MVFTAVAMMFTAVAMVFTAVAMVFTAVAMVFTCLNNPICDAYRLARSNKYISGESEFVFGSSRQIWSGQT